MTQPSEAAQRLRGYSDRRDVDFADLEIRKASPGSDKLQFTGYAALFDTPYPVGRGPAGPFMERINRSAFTRTLSRNPDVPFLINHEGMPLARTPDTLRLSTDSKGLHVDATLDSRDPDVQRIAVKMENRQISQMSFGFRATDDAWNADFTERELLEVNIDKGDVSIVTHGANAATSSRIRSLSAVVEALSDIDPEELLVEARSLTSEGGLTLVEARDLFARLVHETTPQERRTLSVDEAMRLINQ